MTIIEMLLTPNIYSRPQTKLNKVTKIAVHYVGNAGTSALSNRNYFNNLATTHATYAGCHYIIGLTGEIIQCVPENEIAYCTNSANSYSLSIECCHPDSTGKFNTDTYNSLVMLCADICERYGLDPLEDIIRHYDVTKKLCPKWWSPGGGNSNADRDFADFKQAVKNYLKEDKEVVTETSIKINGKDIKINRILKDNKNYIDLRGLEMAGFKVGYDADNKTPTLDNVVKELPAVVDGRETNVEAVNLAGFNYVAVRSVADILGVEVDFEDGKIILNK